MYGIFIVNSFDFFFYKIVCHITFLFGFLIDFVDYVSEIRLYVLNFLLETLNLVRMLNSGDPRVVFLRLSILDGAPRPELQLLIARTLGNVLSLVLPQPRVLGWFHLIVHYVVPAHYQTLLVL